MFRSIAICHLTLYTDKQKGNNDDGLNPRHLLKFMHLFHACVPMSLTHSSHLCPVLRRRRIHANKHPFATNKEKRRTPKVKGKKQEEEIKKEVTTKEMRGGEE
jgi:hypothetical protein